MPVAHILLALLVTLIWGLNFVVIKVGLGDFPPLLFCALRFALAALPLLVLRGPMPAPFGRILLIGVLLGVVKFGLLFVGMAQGMPAGLSSLVLQSQVFFTILIAALWLGERPSPRGLFGLLLAAAGLVLIGLERPLGDSLLAFLLVVAAALAWSFANIATKRSGATDMLRLICWVSLVPPLPLLALSYVFEGPQAIERAVLNMSWGLRRAALHRLRRDHGGLRHLELPPAPLSGQPGDAVRAGGAGVGHARRLAAARRTPRPGQPAGLRAGVRRAGHHPVAGQPAATLRLAGAAAGMKTAEDILALIAADSSRLHLLRVLREVGPEGAWIGAGFVRNAVWDHLHGYGEATPLADIDVLHFAPRVLDPQADADFEVALRRRCEAPWSVKNQARMHLRNGDRPYRDCADALCHWAETCTAVALRLVGERLELLAPLGVDDLLALKVRPTAHFAGKPEVYRRRLREKNWTTRWPLLDISGSSQTPDP